jgi:pyruvate dehydrogenase E2 component (dihydrolipoamide acetyltransferase)
MAFEIKMPQLGLTMTEGMVGAWKVKPGDTVKTADELEEIATDKLTSMVASEVAGQVLSIIATEGAVVPVQGLLCIIGAPGEQTKPVAAAVLTTASAPDIAAVAAVSSAVTATPATPRPRVRISPLAKKEAAAQGLDYSGLAGSGPSGRIILKDILAAMETRPGEGQAAVPALSAAPAGQRERMHPMRKTVAERMLKSHTEIPVVTQSVKADVTALLALREQINAGRETRFSINDFMLKAVAKALASNRHILVSIDGNEIVRHDSVNLGMAVAVDFGLVVPVIRDANMLSFKALAATARDLAARARTGKLAMSEYQGSTFTVSNLGMFRVEFFTPIINQPDAAILGICSIEDELALENGKVSVRKVTRLCLTYDHRLLDGATAAAFQLAVKALLENPMDILL